MNLVRRWQRGRAQSSYQRLGPQSEESTDDAYNFFKYHLLYLAFGPGTCECLLLLLFLSQVTSRTVTTLRYPTRATAARKQGSHSSSWHQTAHTVSLPPRMKTAQAGSLSSNRLSSGRWRRKIPQVSTTTMQWYENTARESSWIYIQEDSRAVSSLV